MFKVTRYVVQPYETVKGVEVRGEATHYRTPEDAIRAADAARKRLARVEVYEVTGWPVQDLWDRPKRIAP